MWRLLTLNALWLGFIFSAHLTGAAWSRRAAAVLILAGSAWALTWPGIDPYAWLYYTGFSWLAYRSAGSFRSWAHSRAIYLDGEIEKLLRRRAEIARALEIKSRDAGRLSQNAAEIAYVYDKIREMSQSLDIPSAFVVLGEATAKIFDFGSMKLALFNESRPEAVLPLEVYALSRGLFTDAFDRASFLKERANLRSDAQAADRLLFEELFRAKTIITHDEPDGTCLIARPVMIDGHVFAVLAISGVPKAQLAILTILTDRFTAEMERVRLYERIQALAVTDGLTGVYVRRHLLERFEGELERSKRLGFKLSFLMIDIDHFKNFNDEYGHLVGDAVLKQVAETIRKSVRELDLVGRYGGEEFGVLLVETDEAGAFYVADRIRRAVGQHVFKAYDENLKVNVSIGVATYSDKLSGSSILIDAADSALYEAKRLGRNKVCVFNVSGKV